MRGDAPSRATRGSWRTQPLPFNRTRILLERRFTRWDWAALKRGFVPQVMEDRWFVFEDDGWLYFHRSWTGYGVYWVRLFDTPTGGDIVEAWVSRDRDQYKGASAEDDVRRLSQLIDTLLLGKGRDAGGAAEGR
jgi:hypothetical protein